MKKAAISVTEPRRIAWGIGEVAWAIGLSASFVRKEIYKGHLRSRMFGKRRLILDQDLQTYLSTRS